MKGRFYLAVSIADVNQTIYVQLNIYDYILGVFYMAVIKYMQKIFVLLDSLGYCFILGSMFK